MTTYLIWCIVILLGILYWSGGIACAILGALLIAILGFLIWKDERDCRSRYKGD